MHSNFYTKLNNKKRLPLPKWKEIPMTKRLESRFKMVAAAKRYKGFFGLPKMGFDIIRTIIKRSLWK